MKNKIQDFIVITFISFLLLIILEIILGLFFENRKSRHQSNKVDRILRSNSYSEKDTPFIKQFYIDYHKLTYEWDPFTKYKLKSYQGKTININQQGNRKTINKDSFITDSTYTIYCFGGSTMFGDGARDSMTIPSLISKELNEKVPAKKFYVTNYGVPAYSRSQETALLIEALKKEKKPDIVIFYDGFNEVLLKFPNYSKNVQEPIKKSYEAIKNSKKQLKLALKSSNINTTIKKIQSKLTPAAEVNYSTVLNDSILNEVIKNYRNNIKIIDAIGNQYDFKVFNYLQPSVYTKKHKTEYENIQFNKQKGLNIVFKKLYQQMISDSILQNSNYFKDVSNCFNNNKENIFIDNCHISEYGNSIISEIIANDIIKSIDTIN
ncbi:SGNH/GDSL hydrolase family protein [uncultured Aquimarina sp.]|uniref:SGNH/GDSL hydrolase family protein n=1 Tax=uncultured Aquimarina sp. TaxID=575652 RepID=UPI002604E177|nr:SGNH/GDSL hydrolase family protein [uncultured Aquimarina sp.]